MDEKVEAQESTKQATAPSPKTAPPPPPPADPPPVAQDAAPERENRREKMSTTDLVMSIATVVIALGTIVSAAAIVLQWRVMVNGGTDTTAIKLAAQKQADAAQRFADTADKMNGNINDAVGKLQTQAGNMSNLARAADTSNQLARDAVENQLGANRPILEFFDFQGRSQQDFGMPAHRLAILSQGATKFEFKLRNTGLGEAQNIRYKITGPFLTRWDWPQSMRSQYIEGRYIEGRFNGPVPAGEVTAGVIPNILGNGESSPIDISTRTAFDVTRNAISLDQGEFYYGELDWDDVIGFGHQWQRIFCWEVGFDIHAPGNGGSVTDCGISEEGVSRRADHHH